MRPAIWEPNEEGNDAEQGARVCYFDMNQCLVSDILPSRFNAACLKCFATTTMPPTLRGVQVETGCTDCGRKLVARVQGIHHKALPNSSGGVGGGGGGRVVKRRAGKRKEDPRGKMGKSKGGNMGGVIIRVGNALPNDGACKHFKKSLRWLRFPCCGKAFPCVACHIDRGADGCNAAAAGLSIMAKRMICGRCSAVRRRK